MIDRIVCLSYDKRQDSTIIEEFESRGWTTERFLAGDGLIYPIEEYDYLDVDVEGRKQAYNYSECLKTILTTSKNLNHSNLLFLEDDAIINKRYKDSFNEIFRITLNAVKDINWDMLYLGGNIQSATKLERISDNVIKANYILDMQATVFNKSCFDKILNIESPSGRTIDGIIADKQKSGEIIALSCIPIIITQKANYSFNEMRNVDRSENHVL